MKFTTMGYNKIIILYAVLYLLYIVLLLALAIYKMRLYKLEKLLQEWQENLEGEECALIAKQNRLENKYHF